MDLTQLHTALENVFTANFVAYYRAHASHINVTGRTFYSDHKLLQKCYEYLQASIDTIGEKIRSCRSEVPRNINGILDITMLRDTEISNQAEDMLREVADSLEILIDLYHELNTAAEEVDYIDISNFAQDQVGSITKLRWMLESTLDERTN